ncbi:double-strand break repair helicase AddA [Altererythrobacter salegens]|uniref:DNA 3'-5' helicase n=1 Tax=Croceibacterium salegens TaxID=1737568 RepID=A0A6I4SVL9_9SPHN|nr:double-strand break repair helicase AddA [Croceibacterium salegens]MXO60085.1 double-strand break repair helicase AddA [Croceibacterium salegens]
MSGKVYPLKGEQALAVDPRDSVWLSASAGTGKTQVLSARVLRLLLTPGVSPSQILCLTFTKAGAAEMATRVNEVLASWVRMDETLLAGDLHAIGARGTKEELSLARSLFAEVLDCPGGGLRIDTIHAFSQWLLGAFPEEAGLIPGTKPMEDRDKDLLAHQVLADLLVTWEEQGDSEMLDALSEMSVRMGPDGARGWLMRCANAREAWIGPGSWQEPLHERVRGLLGLPSDAGEHLLEALCADDVFDVGSLKACRDTLATWNSTTGREGADAADAWLALDPAGRVAAIEIFKGTLFNKSDFATPDRKGKQLNNILKREPAYEGDLDRVSASLQKVLDCRALLELVRILVPALTIGRRFALAWDEAKLREGLIDFDDQIRRAADLLGNSALSDWIRYKLDRQFDHILIDEAQDTNEAQWSIIDALTGDYFAGQGQADGKLRTIFVVGDYKQAIFRFQGTSPENFEAARRRYDKVMAELAANDPDARELRNYGLGRSFRTAQAVLDFVDKAIDEIGPAAFGLANPPEPHVGDQRPGLVALWKPVEKKKEDDDLDEEADNEAPDTWLPSSERRMADRIADQVKRWLTTEPIALVKGEKRNAGPGDIMVLVRKRRELAGLIVARLQAAGVRVAGVDRLRLGAPLAVKDLMAALRFAAQPLDDLSLAGLLVSPLIGWTQEQLLEFGYRPDKTALWDHLRKSRQPEAMRVAEMLRDLLRRADFEPPQALLHWMLVGPWQGRRNLVARLGREANDPIDELLNAALNYAGSYTPSLQGFIRWFDAGDGELKREAGANEGLVRVMTVHGSKGLQAPIVILADATGNPDKSPVRGLELTEDVPGGEGRKLPIPTLGKDERVGRVADAEAEAALAERQEHWRLLYVAMTRAEEALFVGGALGAREDEPAEDSWYARLLPLVDATPIEDPVWGWRLEHGERAPVLPKATDGEKPGRPALPGWATTPVGPEPRPPRPLAPSAVGQDDDANPPLPPGSDSFAARRGVLIHRLLERLPEVPPLLRENGARDWLARQAPDVEAAERDVILVQALAVLEEPGWAEIFGPGALAEVPLAATVEGQVVAGTADRLLVEKDRVLVVDFKTARRPPAGLSDVPLTTLKQMAAYVAALAAIYPGRRIEAAVLYTQTPRLVPIPPELLAEHKAALSPA